MSYHNDPYRVDYLKIYPCLKERPDVLEVLKKSDRKMKYMEVDLKSEQRRKNAENGAESYASKYALSERLVCGECGTLYRRCTWTRNGEKRVVWRCVSRLDYGIL